MSLASRTACLMIGLLVIAASGAGAYPISPVPLWSLTEGSETIVFAEVVRVVHEKWPEPDEEGVSGETFDWNRSVASLRILETWKGSADGEIEVRFPGDLVCPAPPRYVEDEDVVAFLSLTEKGWTTIALSYGTLYPENREELANLQRMVGRAVSLQEKGRISPADRLDWLVEAAALPGTRWHGLYELEPQGDEVHSFYDREDREAFSLSPAHRQRIARGFVERPVTDFTLPMILRLLAGHADPQVDETAAAALEGAAAEKRLPHWFGEALVLVLERFGDRTAEARVAAIRKGCCDLNKKKARALWKTAKSELGISQEGTLEASRRKVRGVGPETRPDRPLGEGGRISPRGRRSGRPRVGTLGGGYPNVAPEERSALAYRPSYARFSSAMSSFFILSMAVMTLW